MLGPHAIETELAYHATTVRWIVGTSMKSAGGPEWNKLLMHVILQKLILKTVV